MGTRRCNFSMKGGFSFVGESLETSQTLLRQASSSASLAQHTLVKAEQAEQVVTKRTASSPTSPSSRTSYLIDLSSPGTSVVFKIDDEHYTVGGSAIDSLLEWLFLHAEASHDLSKSPLPSPPQIQIAQDDQPVLPSLNPSPSEFDILSALSESDLSTLVSLAASVHP